MIVILLINYCAISSQGIEIGMEEVITFEVLCTVST